MTGTVLTFFRALTYTLNEVRLASNKQSFVPRTRYLPSDILLFFFQFPNVDGTLIVSALYPSLINRAAPSSKP